MAKISQAKYDEIGKEIEASTILTEMVACSLICNGLDIMLRDVDKRIRAIYRNHGLNVKVEEDESNIITGMSRYSKAVHNALYWFERDVEKYITDCTFASTGVVSYDDFKMSANELDRFVLMLIDRGKHDGAMQKIFGYLSKLKDGGRFTQEDYDRFILK